MNDVANYMGGYDGLPTAMTRLELTFTRSSRGKRERTTIACFLDAMRCSAGIGCQVIIVQIQPTHTERRTILNIFRNKIFGIKVKRQTL